DEGGGQDYRDGKKYPGCWLLPDVFVPDLGVRADVVGEKPHASFGSQVDHFHSALPEPVDAARKVDRLANDDRTDPKLPDQPAAIPARRERRDHDLVAIASLAARFAKGVRLAMDGRVALLHAAVVAASEKLAVAVEERGADRNSTFGEPAARLLEGDVQKGSVVHPGSVIRRSSRPSGRRTRRDSPS